nr:Chain C, Protection of telomeres protein tpz1 [Schizosaccharomyces pombe 972h-]7CUJ_D Chain D, Protection of telomeres protein tpz1 [Schizosaccharomyces pombe 972h-]
QIELEYKRKPIPDYDFMKGLETTLQELYVEHQSKKRRLELFQLTN